MKRQPLPWAAIAVTIGMIVGGYAAAQNPQASAQAPVTPVSSVAPVAPALKTLPSTKELLQKYEAAVGGHDAWTKFTTRYIKGIYQTEDASGFATIEIFSKAPNKSLNKITFPNGMVLREVCDGKNVWIEDPIGGMHPITGAGLESRIRHSNFNDRVDGMMMAITGHVLGRFSSTEAEALDKVLTAASDQAEAWLEAGIQKAMNQFNGAVEGAVNESNEQ